MRFGCRLTHLADRWQADHQSAEMGQIRVTAATREVAIEKLRGELRYRLELCPCTGESYQHLEIEIES